MSSHIDLESIKEQSKIYVVVFLINKVPTAEIEVYVDRFFIFLFWIIFFVECTNILWIKLGLNFMCLHNCSKSRLVIVDLVNLNMSF